MFSYIIKNILKEILSAVGIVFLFLYSIWSVIIIKMTKTIDAYTLPFVIMYISGVILFIIYRILDLKHQYYYRKKFDEMKEKEQVYQWRTRKYEFDE